MNPCCRNGLILLLGLLLSFGSDPGAALAQAKKKADKSGIKTPPGDANDLSMEVNALRTLHLLRGADPEHTVGTQNPVVRMRSIKNKYASCAQKDMKREEAQVSDGYRKLLVELRAALIAEDEEKIEDLDKKLQDLRKDEEPTLDDRVEISDEARQKTPFFVKTEFTADQVTSYLASYGKDLPNPRSLLFVAMRVKGGKVAQGAKPTEDEWKEIRAFAIREVTWQIGGLNIAKGDRIGENVGKLLDKAYAMTDDELKANAGMLRMEANAIVNKVGPTDLIKHIIEQDVAELLSNPRLIPAVEARLAYVAAKKKQ